MNLVVGFILHQDLNLVVAFILREELNLVVGLRCASNGMSFESATLETLQR